MKVFRVITLVAVLISIAMVQNVAANGKSEEDSATVKVLRVVDGEQDGGLDPAVSSAAKSVIIWELMHDFLVERGPNWEAIPGIAESWDTNNDSSKWTFHIRNNARFSDGSDLTAEDVEYSFKRLMETPVYRGKLAVVDSMEVPDRNTIILNLSRPVPEFLDLVGAMRGYPIFSEAAGVQGYSDAFTKPGTVVSGPWYLDEYVAKSYMVLKKNPYYWREGFPKFDEIRWTFTDDSTAKVAAVEAGDADFASARANHVERLLQNPDVQIFRGIRIDNFRGFGYDLSIPPFNDKRVRQAIGLMVQPDEITEGVWLGYGGTLYGSYWYDNDPWAPVLARHPWKEGTQSEREAHAADLLTEAGWEDRDGNGVRESYGIAGISDGTPLQVTCVNERQWTQSNGHVQLLQQWLKTIGFDMVIEARDKAGYWDMVKNGDFQMWHFGISSSPMPWEKLMITFHPDGGETVYMLGPNDFDEREELTAMIDDMYSDTDAESKSNKLSAISDFLTDAQLVTATGSQDRLQAANADLVGFYSQWNGSYRALLFADIP